MIFSFIFDSIKEDRKISSTSFLSIFGIALIALPFILGLSIMNLKLDEEYLLLTITYGPLVTLTGLGFLIVGMFLGMTRKLKKEITLAQNLEEKKNGEIALKEDLPTFYGKISSPKAIFIIIFTVVLLALFRHWLWSIF